MRLLISALSMLALNCSAAPTMVVTGTWSYYTDEQSLEMLGDSVCFEPSADSVARFPVLKHAYHSSWFCFSNRAKAKVAFALPARRDKRGCGIGGKATVSITDYERYDGEGDDFDAARLLSVSDITRKPLACVP
jgi:hypothetical protein